MEYKFLLKFLLNVFQNQILPDSVPKSGSEACLFSCYFPFLVLLFLLIVFSFALMSCYVPLISLYSRSCSTATAATAKMRVHKFS